MKTLDGTLYRRALDCSGPQSAHTRVISRAGGQSPLWVKRRNTRSEQIKSALPPKAEIGILLKVRFAPEPAVPKPLIPANAPSASRQDSNLRPLRPERSEHLLSC
jgi:hypothetical protein